MKRNKLLTKREIEALVEVSKICECEKDDVLSQEETDDLLRAIVRESEDIPNATTRKAMRQADRIARWESVLDFFTREGFGRIIIAIHAIAIVVLALAVARISYSIAKESPVEYTSYTFVDKSDRDVGYEQYIGDGTYYRVGDITRFGRVESVAWYDDEMRDAYVVVSGEWKE